LRAVLEEADKPMAHVARAIMAMDAQDIDRVKLELDALKEAPGGAEYHDFVSGIIMMRQNKYADALALFGAAKDVPELQVQSYVLSAEALVKLGDPASALGLLNEAVRLEPNLTDAHRWLAQIYYDQGADSAAVLHLNRISDLDPNDYRPSFKMGLMNSDFQDWSGAVGHYDEALSRNPPLPIQADILLYKAQALVKLLEFEKALAILELPIVSQVQDPTYRARADVTRAQCLHDAGQGDEALRLAQGVLDRAPTNLDALVIKGMVLLDKQDYQRAVDTLSMATSVDPYDYLSHYQLSRAYNGNGNATAAQQTLQRADQLKKLREDFSTLHEQADADPSNVEIKVRLGQTARLLGQNEMAFNWFNAVLGLQPDHPIARQQAEELRQLLTPR